jgi:aminocarboxymuconate-semialdehyde decarboxylase
MKHTGPSEAMVMLGDEPFRAVRTNCWDPDLRLSDMDRDGIDIQVISATPVLFSYERPAGQALDCARLFNDFARELCARGQGRLQSLCQVPLQDTDAACNELSRGMREGHLGVQIGNHVGLKDLDDEGVLTFLQHCAAERATVLVHPWDMFARDRMQRYMTPWTVGMPAETQLSIVYLILSGAFDRLPSSLRICFVHGGGSLPFLIGRLDNAWHHHPVARGHCKNPPSHYLSRFHVDSVVFDHRALQYLVDTMGGDRVMLGSDYPFPLGEDRVGYLVRSSRLPEATKSLILGENALQFLGLQREA